VRAAGWTAALRIETPGSDGVTIAPDLGAFQDFIIHELTAAPNVASVKTALVIRASKHAAGVPTELAADGNVPVRQAARARP